jgi:DNA-binding Lrp family transcriptional regulator
LDHAKLGYGITVFAQVALTQSSSENIQEFQKIVAKYPEVRECHMLTGDADSMLKIVAKDWEAFQDFLTDKLTANDLVGSVKSSISVGTPIDRPGVPVEKDLELARQED